MLISSFEPQADSFFTGIMFRGKSVYYWKKQQLQLECQYKPGTGFDVIVVFEPRKFWVAPRRGFQTFVDFGKRQDDDAQWIATVTGEPFYAVSREAMKTINQDLEAGENSLYNILDCFRDHENSRVPVHYVDTGTECWTADIVNDTAAIDEAVVRFQATQYIAAGVRFDDYRNFFIEGFIPIGSGTRIGYGAVITGTSTVGKNTVIYPHVVIENSLIGDDCVLLPGCVVSESQVEARVQIGPYTHLRNGALVKEGAKMGNFVEMKKSTLGAGSKSMHLTYIGDATIGANVNIGAGTITCNYDGVKKHPTVIEDGVFIGSGTELVAPVNIRKNAYVAAGSTSTEEVPEDSLAVARGRQRNIAGWAARKRKKICKP